MTDPRAKKYLFDVLTAIGQVEQFLGSEHNFEQYRNNAMLKSAVERQLIIIGEAVNRLRKHDSTLPLTASRAIVQFRNHITHEYDHIDDENVWAILINHLPQLKKEAKSLLDD